MDVGKYNPRIYKYGMYKPPQRDKEMDQDDDSDQPQDSIDIDSQDNVNINVTQKRSLSSKFSAPQHVGDIDEFDDLYDKSKDSPSFFHFIYNHYILWVIFVLSRIFLAIIHFELRVGKIVKFFFTRPLGQTLLTFLWALLLWQLYSTYQTGSFDHSFQPIAPPPVIKPQPTQESKPQPVINPAFASEISSLSQRLTEVERSLVLLRNQGWGSQDVKSQIDQSLSSINTQIRSINQQIFSLNQRDEDISKIKAKVAKLIDSSNSLNTQFQELVATIASQPSSPASDSATPVGSVTGTYVDFQLQQLRNQLDQISSTNAQFTQNLTGSLQRLEAVEGKIDTFTKNFESIYENINTINNNINTINLNINNAAASASALPASVTPQDLASIDVKVNELSLKVKALEERIAHPISTGHQDVDSHRHTSDGISETRIHEIISQDLEVYASDKVNRIDYASASMGSGIIYKHTSQMSSLSYRRIGAESILEKRHDFLPGECWAFNGDAGQVAIRFNYAVVPDAFTLDHISKGIARDWSSAPKEFQVLGWNLEKDVNVDGVGAVDLGRYVYEREGSQTQTWAITNPVTEPVRAVLVKFLANHGHPQYTCVYRLRVHGKEA